MKWLVHIPEVFISSRRVEAETRDEAIDMALKDLDTEFHHEYSHTLDTGYIDAEEEKNDEQ